MLVRKLDVGRLVDLYRLALPLMDIPMSRIGMYTCMGLILAGQSNVHSNTLGWNDVMRAKFVWKAKHARHGGKEGPESRVCVCIEQKFSMRIYRSRISVGARQPWR